MPELPEVETVARELRPRLVGKRIVSIRVGKKSLRKPWARGWTAKIRYRKVEAVLRRGKWVLLNLHDLRCLVFHLGMTGRLTVHTADEPLPPHTHLTFKLEDGNELRFTDIRRFGSATLMPNSAALERFFVASRLGPEPFDVGSVYWRERLAATKRCLKAVLLDQTVLAGIGNIYADESLFEARVHPARSARGLERTDAECLRKAVVRVLHRAIERRGSSIRDYVGGSGVRGRYQEEFRVYGRTGKPCRRCRTPIERIRLAGRSTHYCPHCQGGVAGC
ncbi:MAG TPA: bifunctional DNA-formamidopyrimidine glycosylase/DNA-(apurinic or apyrimidinic site) lyase [Gemmataceae bacterium]|nr:bifunctional DNA-formamidopyrimidine glycosylase/DNA-(apurinic or apyrimidinic site) lyase [Gemmataceae bacterium]